MTLERLSAGEEQKLADLTALVNRSVNDPSRAADAIAEVAGELARFQQMLRRPRPERAYVVPLTGSVIVGAGGISPIPDTPFVFPLPGRVVGIKGVIREGATLGTHVVLSVTDNEQKPFFQSGIAEAFITLAALSGNPYDQAGFFPFFFRRVQQNEQWTFKLTSQDSLPPSGTNTYTPEISLLIELDRV